MKRHVTIAGQHINGITLSFRDRELEASFQESYFERGKSQLNTAILLGAFLFTIFSPFDVVIVGNGEINDSVLWIWAARAVVVAYLIGCTFVIEKFTPIGVARFAVFSWVFCFLALWFTYVVATSDRATSYLYSFTLISLAGSIFLPLMFTHAAALQFFIFLPILQEYFVDGGQNAALFDDYLYPSLVLISIMFMGLYSKYFQELILRTAFIQQGDLERALNIRDDFLSMVSHELRTPLNGVLGNAQLAQLERSSNENITRRLNQIERSSRAMRTLIDDVLELSRLEASKSQPNRAPLSLATVLADIRAVLEPMCERKSLAFSIEPAEKDAPAILVDGARLRHSLLNLAGNAVKFTRNGFVKILWQYREGQIEFWIEDTGIGVPEDEQERIFEAFTQAPNASSSEFGGAGLGLSLVRRFAEVMDGSIDVQSRNDGGSIFHLIVPAPLTEQTDEQESSEEPATVRSLRLLIVEDDPPSREILESFLRLDGHTVFSVGNGSEALRILDAEHIDVVLSDIVLPGLSGPDLLKAISLRDIAPPIIAVTANSLPADLENYRSIGFADIVPKPVERKVLQSALESVTENNERNVIPLSERSKNLREHLGAQEFARVTKVFSKTLVECAEGLEHAVSQADLNKIKYFAHRLKGSAQSFGESILADHAGRVEADETTDVGFHNQRASALADHCRSVAAKY